MLTQYLIKQIKIKLIEKDITQVQLAKRINISKQYLNNILNGRMENLLIETKILKELEINDSRASFR